VITLQLLVLYTPLNEFLDLDPLNAQDLALCAGAGVGLLALVETVKAVQRR
jgi:Ca2+-transporting ATPase